MKHTPAPWIIKKQQGHIEILHPLINTEDNEYKGTIGGYHVVIGDKNCQSGYILDKANAHLIAVAPDLKFACEMALDVLAINGDIENLKNTLRNVLAKAEGKQ